MVCYDLDRLIRQPRELEDWIDRTESRGLFLVTANGDADLIPEDIQRPHLSRRTMVLRPHRLPERHRRDVAVYCCLVG
ncbi:hypothetical protein ACLUU9_08325 [Rothia mucilaginosa]|uniref:hypothetical protein n=1 Tax=Rothia TaxID=32207 RepID=UPI00114C9A15|nr:hypothetical protein [Rothia mucilaginosa]